jgi:5-methylcytosine-specific restriction endonuclease McrA
MSRVWRIQNLERARENDRAWVASNLDKYSEYRHRRRAHKLTNIHEPYTRKEIYERDNELCFCGELVDLGNYVIDHFVPVSLGGADAPWNVRIAHPSCNSRKHATIPTFDEIMDWCDFLEVLDNSDLENFLVMIADMFELA